MEGNQYEALYQECQEVLRDRGFPVPRAKLKLTSSLLSYVDDMRYVNLGKLVRLFGGPSQVRHSILHELMHVMVNRHPPSARVRFAFGTPEAWATEQRFFRWFSSRSGYVSQYARTHPEEDLVETAVCLLLEEMGYTRKRSSDLCKKIRAVREWFQKLKKAGN